MELEHIKIVAQLIINALNMKGFAGRMETVKVILDVDDMKIALILGITAVTITLLVWKFSISHTGVICKFSENFTVISEVYLSIAFLGYCTGDKAYYGCCTSDHRCGENEGKCIDDGDCKDGLRCGRLNCQDGSYWYNRYDCCYNHTACRLK